MTLEFTNAQEVAIYWDEYEDRSIRPIQPYLWTWNELRVDDVEPDTIQKINREELDWMVIDTDKQVIMVDAAVWVQHQKQDNLKNVIIFTHEQRDDSPYAWDRKVATSLHNKIEAQNLLSQLEAHIKLAFSVVE